MTKPRLAALALTILALVAVTTGSGRTPGQTPDIQEQVQDLLDGMRQVMNTRRPPPADTQAIRLLDPKQWEAIQKVDRLLDEQRVDCQRFQEPMALAKFLAQLQKQLPEGTPRLRIDAEAFGKPQEGVTRPDVEATPVSLKHLADRKQVSLRTALEQVLPKIKIKADYRVDPGAVTITTRARAWQARLYDIGDLLAKAEDGRAAAGASQEWPSEATRQTAALVQTVAASMEAVDEGIGDRIQVWNGNRLVIRTTGTGHAQLVELLAALRRLGDVGLTLHAQLYEVTEDAYQKVKNARRLSPKDWDELAEKQAGDNKPAEPLLKKENLVLAGDAVHVDNGQEAAFLSRYQALQLLPSPEQIAKGDQRPQAVLEGVAFLAQVVVSADRRFVRLKLTERAREIQDIAGGKFPKPIHGTAGIETALLRETTQTQTLDIPDGGSILVAVQHRPRALRAKGTWWVLHINPRIRIESEEREIHAMALRDIVPALLADIVKNPRLKATRDFYGTPGDKRLALLNSGVFQWPADLALQVADHQLAKAERQGKRLLGIRLDRDEELDDGTHALTVTLLNAGGTENGTVPGGGTIRYLARPQEKEGWALELAD